MKRLIPAPILRFLRDLRSQLRNFRTLAVGNGQFRSIRAQSSVDNEGNPIPWFSYPMIEWLSQLDLQGKRVFEWGSGNSSLWWAKRAGAVYSVESDAGWFAKVRERSPENHTIWLEESREGFVAAINNAGGKFDVIVIDGIFARAACAEVAPDFLAPGGMILLDNSDWFFKAVSNLRKKDFIQVDFSGFTPINAYVASTSAFLSRSFNFSSLQSSPPSCPVGGVDFRTDD